MIADTPEVFDVIVMPNLYGDMLSDVAEKIQNAWLKTLEEGIHTQDIFNDATSKQKVGTKEFANSSALHLPAYTRKPSAKKDLVGVDIFLQWNGLDPNELVEKVKKIEVEGVKLTMITNRGIKVWPAGFSETFCTDYWRCRFKSDENFEMNKSHIIQLLDHALNENLDTIKTENLYSFNGKDAFSMGQGQ
ncbi:MAG: Isocitrate dehydrogenase [Bacteroidota bacterium]